MLRALFFAAGLILAALGLALVPVDTVTLTAQVGTPQDSEWLAVISTVGPNQQRIVDPPSWLGYTMLGLGVVTVLYSLALPRYYRYRHGYEHHHLPHEHEW